MQKKILFSKLFTLAPYSGIIFLKAMVNQTNIGKISLHCILQMPEKHTKNKENWKTSVFLIILPNMQHQFCATKCCVIFNFSPIFDIVAQMITTH